ncbi:MAG: M20 family metallo-hydrolase [Cytophagales bacterium]|nr:M20 family metallo-hydrolase [Cytophagales bacterium]
MKQLYDDSLALLKQLIATPSMSKEEDETAQILAEFLKGHGVEFHRSGNNIWAQNKEYQEGKLTILLNSHHDTVKPNKGYTKNPFTPVIEEGKLYGLGSNDAGGCLVSLIATFLHFYEQEIPFNLVLAATAEEENSGRGGVESILSELGQLDYGIIGEPTEMNMAVAEKGLMVLDCKAQGVAGHAARDIGKNAIYEALKDIEWFRTYQYPVTSEYLGPIKMSVTQIQSGYQHNVIPDSCEFVVDVRTTDAYTNEEVLSTVQEHVSCEVKARSTRLRPSQMPEGSPIRNAGEVLGIKVFGSPTTSDQAVIPIPTIKMGPGRSERSHTPDEFIYLQEIENGIVGYIRLLEELKSNV